MKKLMETTGAMIWGYLAVIEVGASASWWAGSARQHWWLAGAFVYICITHLREMAR